MADKIIITSGASQDVYSQISKALCKAISDYQESGKGVQPIELNSREVTITTLPDEKDEGSVKVRVLCEETDVMRTFYLYLRNPDDDIEEIVDMIVDMTEE